MLSKRGSRDRAAIARMSQCVAHASFASSSLTSPYPFSGLLKCGLCGSNLIVASGRVRHRNTCVPGISTEASALNNLYIRPDELEERLLGRLRTELLQPEAVDTAVESFGRQLRASLASVSNQLTETRSRKERNRGWNARFATSPTPSRRTVTPTTFSKKS
jgi:hypothetical protein